MVIGFFENNRFSAGYAYVILCFDYQFSIIHLIFLSLSNPAVVSRGQHLFFNLTYDTRTPHYYNHSDQRNLTA
jgi:hypothetical protein